MDWHSLGASASLAGMTATAGNPQPAQLGPWREVRPGVHVLVAEPHAVNLGLVVGGERCLLIDTGSTPDQGRALRERTREVTDVPLAGALVTHAHVDHWGGLGAFADLESWGHESLTEEAGQRVEAPDLPDVADRVAPASPFSIAVAIDLGGGVRVEALHLGRAHSPSDVMVLVPTANLLFAGDLVELAGEPEAPWFGPDSSPKGWPEVLNLAMSMIDADTVVVPGHGRIGGRDDLVSQMGALAGLPYEAERLVQASVPFERAQAEGQWPFPWANIEHGVRLAYAEMNALGVRTRLPITRADLGE